MILEEIFATNPGLLEEPEVKNLIQFVKEQHERSWKINQALKKIESDVLDIAMHSEVFLINGKPAEESIEKILEVILL